MYRHLYLPFIKLTKQLNVIYPKNREYKAFPHLKDKTEIQASLWQHIYAH